MVDASKKSYFIQWPNGSIYNQTIGSGLQYVWNFSNPAAADYVISSTLADLADPAVDGSYMDDGPYGMPLENPIILQNINMSIATLAAYQKTAVMSYVKVMSGMVAAHKYSYQEMGWYGQYAAISQTQCSSFMRELCKPEMQNHPLMMHAQSAPGSTVVLNQTIAAFLIARPPVAFIGFPWSAAQQTASPCHDSPILPGIVPCFSFASTNVPSDTCCTDDAASQRFIRQYVNTGQLKILNGAASSCLMQETPQDPAWRSNPTRLRGNGAMAKLNWTAPHGKQRSRLNRCTITTTAVAVHNRAEPAFECNMPNIIQFLEFYPIFIYFIKFLS